MAERPVLTIAMVDALMDVLNEDWVCPAGYRHRGGQWCFHPLPPAVAAGCWSAEARLMAVIPSPDPMSITLEWDDSTDMLRLKEPWWPARLLVDGMLLGTVQMADTPEMTYDGTTLGFALANATATYRLVGPVEAPYVGPYGCFEFDCVACSRDVGGAG